MAERGLNRCRSGIRCLGERRDQTGAAVGRACPGRKTRCERGKCSGRDCREGRFMLTVQVCGHARGMLGAGLSRCSGSCFALVVQVCDAGMPVRDCCADGSGFVAASGGNARRERAALRGSRLTSAVRVSRPGASRRSARNFKPDKGIRSASEARSGEAAGAEEPPALWGAPQKMRRNPEEIRFSARKTQAIPAKSPAVARRVARQNKAGQRSRAPWINRGRPDPAGRDSRPETHPKRGGRSRFPGCGKPAASCTAAAAISAQSSLDGRASGGRTPQSMSCSVSSPGVMS